MVKLTKLTPGPDMSRLLNPNKTYRTVLAIRKKPGEQPMTRWDPSMWPREHQHHRHGHGHGYRVVVHGYGVWYSMGGTVQGTSVGNDTIGGKWHYLACHWWEMTLFGMSLVGNDCIWWEMTVFGGKTVKYGGKTGHLMVSKRVIYPWFCLDIDHFWQFWHIKIMTFLDISDISQNNLKWHVYIDSFWQFLTVLIHRHWLLEQRVRHT